MRTAIIGSNGQLGRDLCKIFESEQQALTRLTHRDLEVCDAEQVERVLGEIAPEVVINTAAFHQVEKCELDPTMALAVNAVGARNLATTCRRLDAVLVHFSTDYVFGGDQRVPYTETDLPGPLNVYGASKLAGEAMVALTWPKHYIVRTCGLYGVAGSSGKGGNFVETMLKKAGAGETIRVVDDQVLTPTFTEDLAASIGTLIKTGRYGLYHISAEGECSWYEFARKIFELQKIDCNPVPVSTSAVNSSVVRPSYSVLSKVKLNSLGIDTASWNSGLLRYLQSRSSRKDGTPVAV